MTINNTDSNEGVYDFKISAVATAPILPCSDLFISEYVEGSGKNKAIEILT